MAIIKKTKKKRCESRDLKTAEIEIAVASFMDSRTNLIVPNVHWGMDIHECDLFVLTPAGYGWEVEIKITKADLVNDAKKRHGHIDHRIKNLYFAIPKFLEAHIEHIPARAGIIVVVPDNDWNVCYNLRQPISNQRPYKFSDAERYQVARLGALRIWDLKRKLNNIKNGDGNV